MARSITGGCSCGAVRYECSIEPVFTANCHCRDCQRASGGGFVSVLAVPRDALKISGEVKYYDVKGDSGNLVSRGFCPNCGSRLFARPAAAPTVIGIMAGSLDDSGWYRSWPTSQVKVTVNNPLDAHSDQLGKYTDDDMHNLMAYLLTLK